MMIDARKLGMVVALVAPAATACADNSSEAPPNGGTLIVHVTLTGGPANEQTGRAALEMAMAKADTQVRASNGSVAYSKTDRHGNARFVLEPGVYVARLVNHLASQCGVRDSPATARVRPHRVARVEVNCVQP